MVGMPMGNQVWPASLREHHTVVARRGHIVAVRGDGEIVALAHHRPALPGCALVVAGEQAVAGGGDPHVAGDVERVDELCSRMTGALTVFSMLTCVAVKRLGGRLQQRVGDGRCAAAR